MRALTISPTIRAPYHRRGIHGKPAEATETPQKAGQVPGAVEGSLQSSIHKTAVHLAQSTDTAPEKTPGPSGDEFWRNVPIWKDVGADSFMSYRWSVRDPPPFNLVSHRLTDANIF